MQIALAHDSFTQMGGAERMVEGTHELFPDAPVYTVVVDRKLTELSSWKLRPTWLQRVYNLYPHFQHLFAFIPFVLATTKKIDADVLFSSGSSYGKGFRVTGRTVHINYCHTPTRFLWVDPQHAYKEIFPLLRPLAKLYFAWLRRWDYRAAQKVDSLVANSKEVQRRIKECYGRDSTVIYPYIDIHYWKNTKPKADYFLIAGRLQRAKGLDMVVEVFNELGWPLHVVGTGRYESYLRSLAKPNVKFLGRVSDNVLRDEYSGARAFIFPQLEDFGLMPLEAAACGTPTIALAAGGSLETVIPSVTGELLEIVNHQTLTEAVKAWQVEKYNQSAMRAHAENFSKEIFQNKVKQFIHENSH